ncbi:MAG: lamin tail domain-containing protein [Candidatus Komeilibacteria bacterium]
MVSQDLQKMIAIIAFGILLALLLSHTTIVLAATAENDIIFSEIMYDVSGGDSGREWVEIYNSSDQVIDITEQWRFWDGSSHLLNTEIISLAPQQAAIIVDDPEAWRLDYPDYDGLLLDSVINLRNDGEELKLSFDSGETWSISTIYDNQLAAGDGYSLVWQNDQWQQSDVLGGDPGVYNMVGDDICNCPVIVCPTDDSTTTDDNDNSDDISDQNNDYNEDVQQENDNSDSDIGVNNDNDLDDENNNESLNPIWQVPASLSAANFYINELWPNPPGSDAEAEFIELYNNSNITIELSGWELQDNGHNYDLSGTIESGHYLVIDYSLSHLSLNNGGETISLIDPSQQIWMQVDYSGGGENSYSRTVDGSWQWVESATPGETNYIPVNNSPVAVISGLLPVYNLSDLITASASDSYDDEGDELSFVWDWGDGESNSEAAAQHQYQAIGDYQIVLTVSDAAGGQDTSNLSIQIVDDDVVVDGMGVEDVFSLGAVIGIGELRNMDIKDEATTRGVITAPPGLLATRYFYMVGFDDDQANPDMGIQLYYSGDDLPELSAGDVVQVSGALSQSGGEKRFKVSQAQDFIIIDQVTIPELSVVATGEINDDWEGALVRIQGQVVKKQGSSWYVDDGSGEIKIYFSKYAAITKPEIDSGSDDQVLVAGIVGETSSGFRILPRFDDDIVVLAKAVISPEQSIPENVNIVDESVVNSEPIVPVAGTNDNYVGYGVALAGFSLVSWVVKAKFL